MSEIPGIILVSIPKDNLKPSNRSKSNLSFRQLNHERDAFMGRTKVDGSNDGRFTLGQVAKNFFKGIISPLTAIIKHPLATIGTLAAVGTACFAVPALTPILTIGFGALSIFQLLKSAINTVKDYKNGDYDKAEKGFEGIGQGVIGTLMTFLGLKQSAKIAAESKVLASTGAKALNQTQKAEIAEQIAKGGIKNAFKENLSIITTKQGRQALINQLKPSAIKEKFVGLINILKRPQKPLTQEQQIENFKKSPEGIRRAALSKEQLQTEVTAKYNQAFEELGIPKEQRPKLEIFKGGENEGGYYSRSKHTIKVNSEAYKDGIFELDDVIMHEATHCKEALLRAGLPQERVDQIIIEELTGKILNGESEQILVKPNILAPDMMDAPKLPNGMKQDFAKLAREKLYTKDETLLGNLSKHTDAQEGIKIDQKTITMLENSTKPADLEKIAQATKSIAKDTKTVQETQQKLAPFLKELQEMMNKYPEFQAGYKSPEEALLALEKYSLSHGTRYKHFTNTKIPGVEPQTLSPETAKLAEISLRNDISSTEGNARISGFNSIFGSEKGFNQYQFSPEEVLAQQNGNNFLIKNYSAKLNEMKANGTLTPEMEAYLTGAINRAKATIAYKTKGLEYYSEYTNLLNNPTDEALAQKVATLKAELDVIGKQLQPEEIQQIQQIIGQSIGIPHNLLPTIDILNN